MNWHKRMSQKRISAKIDPKDCLATKREHSPGAEASTRHSLDALDLGGRYLGCTSLIVRVCPPPIIDLQAPVARSCVRSEGVASG